MPILQPLLSYYNKLKEAIADAWFSWVLYGAMRDAKFALMMYSFKVAESFHSKQQAHT